MRKLSYSEAIREALQQLLESDQRISLLGHGFINSGFSSLVTDGFFDKYGPERIVDTANTGGDATKQAVLSAMSGKLPILVHNEPDFSSYSANQIQIHAANWYHQKGGIYNVPLMIWAIEKQFDETITNNPSACQPTPLYSFIFSSIDSSVFVAPSTPFDMKGLFVSCASNKMLTILVDHPCLHEDKGDVPKDLYEVPVGKGIIRREGQDLTLIVASGLMPAALIAANKLVEIDISIEVVDIRTIRPLDLELIYQSVSKTGRLAIAMGRSTAIDLGAYIYEALTTKNILGHQLVGNINVINTCSDNNESSQARQTHDLRSIPIVDEIKQIMGV